MPEFGRRDQIVLHLRVEREHIKAIYRHVRALFWDLRGLIRAILGR
jgi:hypothetical protein